MARGRSFGRGDAYVKPGEILRRIKEKPVSKNAVSWGGIFQDIIKHKRSLAKANALAVFSMLATISLPLLLPLLVDEVVLNEPGRLVPVLQSVLPPSLENTYGYIIFITLLSVCLRFIGLGLDILQTRIFSVISKGIIYEIRIKALNYLRRVPVGEFETLGAGKIANHFTTDINTMDDFMSAALSKFLIGALSLLGVVFVMLWISPLLTLFLVLFNPLVAILTQKLGKYIKKLKQVESQSVEVFQGSLTETFEAIRQIKVSNREEQFFTQLNTLSNDIRKTSMRFSWLNDTAERMSMFVFMFGFDIFRAFAIALVAVTTMTIGEMFAMIGYLWFMLGAVQSVLQIQYSFHSANGALERINGLLSMPFEEDFKCEVNPFESGKPIALKVDNLSFGYKPNDLVLRDVSFVLEAGKKIGIKGESGCGKSTLVQVLMGLYHKTGGDIYYDGVPLEKIGYKMVRENVATVMQHPSLLNSTLRYNMCLGGDYEDDELWEALKIAQLQEAVEKMPQKLDSNIGTRGVRMSGGQLQRLSIARALLTKPNILILDEATSALDEKTEEKLHKSLNQHFPKVTSLIIAHRSSALNQADLVYEMQEGKLLNLPE